MIKGIGLDIIDIVRVEKAACKRRFYTKNFTEDEIALFEARNYSMQVVAGNFAAKEAILKCLRRGIFDMPLYDIEILREESGEPYAVLHGKAAQRAAQLAIKSFYISISHAGGFAAAQAVAEGE